MVNGRAVEEHINIMACGWYILSFLAESVTSLMTEMVLEILVYSPVNCLAWLLARENFIEFFPPYLKMGSHLTDSHKVKHVLYRYFLKIEECEGVILCLLKYYFFMSSKM